MRRSGFLVVSFFSFTLGYKKVLKREIIFIYGRNKQKERAEIVERRISFGRNELIWQGNAKLRVYEGRYSCNNIHSEN